MSREHGNSLYKIKPPGRPFPGQKYGMRLGPATRMKTRQMQQASTININLKRQLETQQGK